MVCYQPWNFEASSVDCRRALAAGNSMLAKPAEQTPLIAARGVAVLEICRRALFNCCRVAGEPGAATMTRTRRDVHRLHRSGHLRSTIASRLIPGRPTPLIAETGGMNAMIVDSSALTEQW